MWLKKIKDKIIVAYVGIIEGIQMSKRYKRTGRLD